MGKSYGKFKYSIGEIINDYNRYLQIVDCKYVDKEMHKNKKPYISHQKWYKYKCLNCNNEDWVLEDPLYGKQHIGCNACCMPPKKLLVGVNDITTTAPWMVKYFFNKEKDANKYFKFSKEKVKMICPYCSKEHITTPLNVYTAHGLSCICQDNISYPNKFMYSMLEQIGVTFETEKSFEWSDNKKYDNYIIYEDLKIITEQHGIQHYIDTPNFKRSLDDEKKNDIFKREIALENGINYYFEINSSESTIDYMKESIINSGLLTILKVDHQSIDWQKCDKFASSNLVKTICEFKNNHPNILLKEYPYYFKLSYKTILRYIKKGAKYGWCSYELFEDTKKRYANGDRVVNQRPIHCISNDKYYRNSQVFVEQFLLENGIKLSARNIRSVCSGNRNHVNNMKFEFITQEEFNQIKYNAPDIVYGNFFKLK